MTELEKGIHLEVSKRLKLDQTSKWYPNKPEYFLKNETHKSCVIQLNHLISVRRPVQVIIKK